MSECKRKDILLCSVKSVKGFKDKFFYVVVASMSAYRQLRHLNSTTSFCTKYKNSYESYFLKSKDVIFSKIDGM